LKCFADVTEPTKNAHGVLEEHDPSYEEMLKHMVGRITTKPGGKPEMGDVSLLIPKCSPFVNKMLKECSQPSYVQIMKTLLFLLRY